MGKTSANWVYGKDDCPCIPTAVTCSEEDPPTDVCKTTTKPTEASESTKSTTPTEATSIATDVTTLKKSTTKITTTKATSPTKVTKSTTKTTTRKGLADQLLKAAQCISSDFLGILKGASFVMIPVQKQKLGFVQKF